MKILKELKSESDQTGNILALAVKYHLLAVSVFSALLFLLGVSHHVVFYLQINVPIFQLSEVSDYLHIGLKQIPMLVAVIVYIVIAVYLIVLLLCFVIICFSCLTPIVCFLVRFFPQTLVGCLVIFLYVFCLLTIGLYSGTIYHLYRIFWKSLEILRPEDNLTVDLMQKTEQLQLQHTSKINLFRKSYDRQEIDLKNWLNRAEQGTKTYLQSIVAPLERKVENKWELGKWGFRISWIVFIVFTLVAMILKTNYEHSRMVNYIAVHDKEINWYDKWFLPITRVEVSFRQTEKKCPENMLLIGSTSDYLIFWQAEIEDGGTNDAGEPSIVPKSNISKILPIPMSMKTKYQQPTECAAP